ncbi:hypothetical protein DVH24_019482 [Malus domestica]|uniref:Uncharacterized protein n=1 Tax=Malus domestica TaxID=3750 RepID=A0A498I347_MALDO|nr:hypothetical protein DVH24_019482 [Malus domestica]
MLGQEQPNMEDYQTEQAVQQIKHFSHDQHFFILSDAVVRDLDGTITCEGCMRPIAMTLDNGDKKEITSLDLYVLFLEGLDFMSPLFSLYHSRFLFLEGYGMEQPSTFHEEVTKQKLNARLIMNLNENMNHL